MHYQKWCKEQLSHLYSLSTGNIYTLSYVRNSVSNGVSQCTIQISILTASTATFLERVGQSCLFCYWEFPVFPMLLGIPSAYCKASFAFVLYRLRFFIGGTLFCFSLENRTCAILPTSYLKITGISQFGIIFFLKGMIHIIKYNLYLHWDFPVFSNTFQKLSHNDSF